MNNDIDESRTHGFQDPVNIRTRTMQDEEGGEGRQQQQQGKTEEKTICAKMLFTFLYLTTILTIILVTTACVYQSAYLPRGGENPNNFDMVIQRDNHEFQDVTITTVKMQEISPRPTKAGSLKAFNRNKTLYSVIPNLSDCGHKSRMVSGQRRRRRKRIIGGTKVDDEFLYPWLAQIAADVPNLGETYHCAGSLISKRYVLTSAHCIYNKTPTHVRLRDDPDIFQVDEINIHPDYIETVEQFLLRGYKARFDDISLIRLSRDATFNHPICLPFIKRYSLDKNDFASFEGQVAGYGYTSNTDKKINESLHEVSLVTVENKECQTYFNSTPVDIITDRMFCATGESKDFCEGDSGAPFFVIKDRDGIEEKVFQLGIATYGNKVCGIKPGVFTRTSNYLTFILDTIRE